MGTKEGQYIIIRADASSQMGIGHMMRCLSLAQAWQLEGGHAIILSHCESDALRQRITDAGVEFMPLTVSQDLEATLEVLRTRSAGKIENLTGLVLDGYHFDPVYQQAVQTAGYRLLVIDDMAHLPAYHADILHNQNVGAEKLKYNCDPDTTLLLGSRYVLLRQEFLAWRSWQREIPEAARKVLVTMGGSDPDNVTLKIIHALELVRLDGLEAVVVVGGNSPHYEILQSAIRNLQFNIRLERDTSNMPELMAWADMAISGGGSTCYELAFMGLPSLVIVLADNQRMVASGLESAKISINLGWYANVTPQDIAHRLSELTHSPKMRAEMSSRGKNLVDGYGATRVIQWMYARTLALRDAQESDSRLIFEWANDPTTRAVSFSTESIPWETHQAWYKAKLSDPYGIILLALDPSGIPVGMVRYQLDGMESVVSINLDPHQRGKGYGSQILKLSAKKLFQTGKTGLIHAYIKPDNMPSIHVFTKAGFVEKGKVVFQGNTACHFILSEELL